MNISKWSIFNSLRAEKFNELSTCLNKPLKTCQNKEKEEINAGIGEWIVATTLSACLLWHFYVMCFFAFFSVAVKAAKEKFPNKQHQSTWWGGERRWVSAYARLEAMNELNKNLYEESLTPTNIKNLSFIFFRTLQWNWEKNGSTG